jgi:hypothetical protein
MCYLLESTVEEPQNHPLATSGEYTPRSQIPVICPIGRVCGKVNNQEPIKF